jgi:hypothetical protein
MAEFLVILQLSITKTEREALLRLAPPTQSISNSAYLAVGSEAVPASLRSMAGVAVVLTGKEPAPQLPHLDDAESLFVQAWLSTRGQVKQRLGDGLDWDTPPMLPPDQKR